MVFKQGPDVIQKLLLIDFDYAVQLHQLVQYSYGTVGNMHVASFMSIYKLR
jgi:hypothetical protein